MVTEVTISQLQSNKPEHSTNVDTASYQVGYNAGLSTAFTLEVSTPAQHVDVRNVQGRHEIGTLRSQLRPVKWDQERGLDAAAEFHKHKDPYSLQWEEVRHHVALMYERFTFFHQQYNVQGNSPEWYVEMSLARGPSFTSEYASRWKEGRFDWANVERFEPVIDDKKTMEWPSYLETYPPFFFIFWEEEVEDYEYMFQGEPNPDPDTLQELEDTVAELSEELLPSGDFSVPDEVVWRPSATGGYDTGAGRTRPEWEIEFDDPSTDFIDDHLTFIRGYAMKRPSETRDIGTQSPSSIRLHRKIMYPMQRACSRIKGCVYGRDQGYIRKLVQDFGERFRYFYMRDYTKSGMTMPVPVRLAILRGFYRRNPKLQEKYCKAFGRLTVHFKKGDDIESRLALTGSPLGMFVEGFTLMQYAIDRMIRSSLPDQHLVYFNATNDDMVAGCRDKEVLTQYVERDSFINRDLRNLVKVSKSGISTDRFFYCEEYWDGESILNKENLTSGALLGCKYAVNVVHAKELANSILQGIPYWSHAVRNALKIVQEHFQPEFSEQETGWPYLFGGWLPHYRDGLDSSILWRNGDLIPDLAYWACREEPNKCKTLKEDGSLGFARMKGIRLLNKPSAEEDYLALIPLFGTKGALRDYYSAMNRHPKSLSRYYNKKYIMRQKAFVGFQKGTREAPNVLDGWLKRHPNSVIVPLPGMELRKATDYVYDPKLGLYHQPSDLWLLAMHQLGYIDYPAANERKVSGSVLQLCKSGLTKEIDYRLLGIVEGVGISSYVLKTHIKGLSEFTERTGLTITKAFPEDHPSSLSAKWSYLPKVPLTWIYRMDKYTRHLNIQIDANTAWWYQKILDDKFKIEDPEFEGPQIELEDQPLSNEAEERYLEILRGLLDSSNEVFRGKIIPIGSEGHIYGHINPTEQAVPAPAGYIVAQEGSYIPIEQPSTDFWSDSGSEDGTYGVLEGF